MWTWPVSTAPSRTTSPIQFGSFGYGCNYQGKSPHFWAHCRMRGFSMRSLLGTLGLLTLLGTGCAVHPYGPSVAVGGSVGVYDEYPHTTYYSAPSYGHSYYPKTYYQHRYYRPYQSERYIYRY